jgi:hypothetical protein
MDLDYQRSVSFGGGVDGGGQPGRAGAKDDQVIVVVLRAGRKAGARRQFGSP